MWCVAEQVGRRRAAVEQLAVMRARHLDADRAGLEDLADQLVRLLGGQLRAFALGDVDAGDHESTIARRAVRDIEPVAA